MDIIEFLSIDSSRLNADLLVEKFEEDSKVFDTILDVMYQDTYTLSMRASRVVWLIARKYPSFIDPYLPELIELFEAQLPCDSRGVEARIKDALQRLRSEVL